jgi:hypothetical protein
MRKIVIIAAAAAVTAVAWAVVPHGHARADYRDPVQLAAAVKSQEHAASASCAQLSGLAYLCSVATTGLTMGTYQVTVAADGSSYRTAVP